jgi:flagellar assembly protein FliH
LSAEVVVRSVRFPSFSFVEEPAPAPPALPTAVQELATAREAGHRDGLARGHEEGRAAALAEWAPRLEALAAALEQATAVARAERERLAADITETVPRAAVVLARKVIERELADGGAALRAAVDPVVRRLAQGGATAVRLAPDVAEALVAWREEGDRPSSLAGVTIHADASLGRGDWIIESDGGLLDGRLATQLEEAGRLLTEPEA